MEDDPDYMEDSMDEDQMHDEDDQDLLEGTDQEVTSEEEDVVELGAFNSSRPDSSTSVNAPNIVPAATFSDLDGMGGFAGGLSGFGGGIGSPGVMGGLEGIRRPLMERFQEYYRCFPTSKMPGKERDQVNYGGKSRCEGM